MRINAIFHVQGLSTRVGGRFFGWCVRVRSDVSKRNTVRWCDPMAQNPGAKYNTPDEPEGHEDVECHDAGIWHVGGCGWICMTRRRECGGARVYGMAMDDGQDVLHFDVCVSQCLGEL